MTDDELKHLFETMRQENAAAQSDTRRHVDVMVEAMGSELRHRFDVVTEMVETMGSELRHHFDVVTEGTRSELRLVAESVVLTNEKIGRTAASLEDKVERTATETQAMIKFSHAEIDRRMRTLEENQRSLEETVADLQARVGRLEGSTH